MMPRKKKEKEKAPEPEVCQAGQFLKNKPQFFRKKKVCESRNILLLIQEIRKGKKIEYPICRDCWDKIAVSEVEW